MTDLLTRLRAARLTVPTVMTVIGLLILLALGTWQLNRKAWKEDVLQALDVRSNAPALMPEAVRALRCTAAALPLGDARECEFLKAQVVGTFDHARERHVFAAIDPQRDGNGGPGYWVFTPLKLEGGGEIIVNRGHVPQRLKAPDTRRVLQSEGRVTVVGLLRRPQTRSRFDGANDGQRNIYYVRDLIELGLAPVPPPALTVAIGSPEALSTFYLDAIGQVPPVAVPIALGASPRLSNRHLEYAFTWYAFAATLTVIFLLFARGRLRSAQVRPPV